jgi:hypothetical protein
MSSIVPKRLAPHTRLRSLPYNDMAICMAKGPEDLAFRDERVKVTLALTKRSVDFFEREATKHNTQYQRLSVRQESFRSTRQMDRDRADALPLCHFRYLASLHRRHRFVHWFAYCFALVRKSAAPRSQQ